MKERLINGAIVALMVILTLAAIVWLVGIAEKLGCTVCEIPLP